VRIHGFEVQVQGSRFKVQGSRFKVQGSRFKVQGSRFKVTSDGFLQWRPIYGVFYYNIAFFTTTRIGLSRKKSFSFRWLTAKRVLAQFMLNQILNI
jgi:hypothetical protein